jgi:hypothetical protein
MLTAVVSLCGQDSTGPTGVCDQSNARVRAPISPPPARKSDLRVPKRWYEALIGSCLCSSGRLVAAFESPAEPIQCGTELNHAPLPSVSIIICLCFTRGLLAGSAPQAEECRPMNHVLPDTIRPRRRA